MSADSSPHDGCNTASPNQSARSDNVGTHDNLKHGDEANHAGAGKP